MILERLIRDRGTLFWVLNAAGWTGYTLAAWLGALAHEKPDSYVQVILVTAATGLLLTIPMRLIYRRLWTQSIWPLGIGTLLTCFALALPWRWLENSLYWDWVKDTTRKA